jgi:hypothetical protein
VHLKTKVPLVFLRRLKLRLTEVDSPSKGKEFPRYSAKVSVVVISDLVASSIGGLSRTDVDEPHFNRTFLQEIVAARRRGAAS